MREPDTRKALEMREHPRKVVSDYEFVGKLVKDAKENRWPKIRSER